MTRMSRSIAFGMVILATMNLPAGNASPVSKAEVDPRAESPSEKPSATRTHSERFESPEMLLSSGRVRMRVRIEPDGEIFLGQQIRLLIEVLTDTWFTRAPRYPELDLPGAITLLPEEMGTNFTERIDAVTFAGQRRGYVIFPERAGRLDIPAIEITLGISTNGRDGEIFAMTTNARSLDIIAPPEMENLDGLFTTTRFAVSDEWERTPDDLKVGDAIRRTLRMEADRTLGMLLPDVAFEAPPGIAVYPDAPRVLDHIHRGQFRGERVESVTYLLQESGRFELPPIEMSWWDSGRGELRKEVLEASILEVRGVGAGLSLGSFVSNLPSRFLRVVERFAFWIGRHFGLLFGVGIAFAAGLRLWSWPPVRERLMSKRMAKQRRVSERLAFRAFEHSLDLAADPNHRDEVVRRYWRWRDAFRSARPNLSEDIWNRASAESGFARRWSRLEVLHYGGVCAPPEAVDFEWIGRDLRALRARLRSLTRAKKTKSNANAIELNPRPRPDQPIRSSHPRPESVSHDRVRPQRV